MSDNDLHNIILQKHQLQASLLEVESALEELETTPEAYRIIGGIMVKADPETLKEELSKKKELAELRLKNLEKQEKSIQEDKEDEEDE